jgi:plasmid maintenance system killer protein
MIRSFIDKEAEKIWERTASRRLPFAIQNVARRKLRMLDNAINLNDLRAPPAIGSRHCQRTVKGSTAFASMINGVSAFVGRATGFMTWKLSITTEKE